MTVADVLAEVARDSVFFDDSSGGVTFSGGEPLLQDAFLMRLLEASRAQGLHTAVDTCGFAPTETLLSIARLTDLFLYDLKTMDDAKHRQFTGVSNDVILENLMALDRGGSDIWIRIPLVPGVNDDEAELGAMMKFLKGLSSVRQVNLLPYHRTGIQKSRRLGRSPRLAELGPESTQRAEAAARLFEVLGVPVRIGG